MNDTYSTLCFSTHTHMYTDSKHLLTCSKPLLQKCACQEKCTRGIERKVRGGMMSKVEKEIECELV